MAEMTELQDKECGGQHADAFQGNAEYFEALYQQWLDDPNSLPQNWQYFFEGFELASCTRPCVASDQARAQANVGALIDAYRTRGHLLAKIDPLGTTPEGHPELELGAFGLSKDDMNTVFDTGSLKAPPRASLETILSILNDTYCGSIGIEYMHIQEPTIRRWLQDQMELGRNKPNFDRSKKLAILENLIDAELFETFLQTHYTGQKRFSLEGAETLLPALHAFVEQATALNIDMVILGMPHRGRLNVLANILDKSYKSIFVEFEDALIPDQIGGDGDVKYHKGYTSVHDGKLTVSLTSNPSHLEAVNPVVEGRARAFQWKLGDTEERKRVVPLLIHGDAAFAGQGLVAETLNLSQLEGYRTGGTVHLVVNNQIGFTASPEQARSSTYATDVLKMIEAPIFHVNADDIEAVVYVVELALRFRQQFSRDVGIDMVCYRRHGHSEVDDPAFTHPLMYEQIKKHASPLTIYTNQLISSGDLTREDEKRLEEEFKSRLSSAFKEVKTQDPECTEETCIETVSDFDDKNWEESSIETRVSHERLIEVTEALIKVPDGFSLSRKLSRKLPKQLDSVKNKENIDWGFAEALSLGTLLNEGTPVRLSGQDSMRGTFSHRHAVWYDVNTNQPYTPLNNISTDQARFCVYNSSLTEAAVLGFEYGYSLDAPEMFILWEAQFGDFANGAQVIIDQFLVSSQAKWQRTSGLVLLLPHGYEGQGPEHSNAYLERYLIACAQNNIQVCNLTTPGQYFHVLRRQMKRDFRRPLIIMSPKSLLRHPKAVSNASELVDGHFQEVLTDTKTLKKPKRALFCTGKIYYDLLEYREKNNTQDIAIIRIEQLYPFPHKQMAEVLSAFSGVEEYLWVQEEPENRGAYRMIRPRIEAVLEDGKQLVYDGRLASASPATGSLSVHKQEQNAIVEQAFKK